VPSAQLCAAAYQCAAEAAADCFGDLVPCQCPLPLLCPQVVAVQQGGCFAEEVVAPAAATWLLPGEM
jgi:hypothetical protein